MPEKACQNPLTSPVWPKKGSCSPGDSSLFLCLGVGRGAIFPNRKNGWRKTRRAGGAAWFAVGPAAKRERGGRRRDGDGRRAGGSAMCRGLSVGAWLCGCKRSCLGEGDTGKGRVVVSPRRITFRKGARGGRARRGKRDCGKGRVVVSPRRITLRKGARGARARRGKGDCGKGGAVVSPRRITLGKGRGAAGRGGAREIAGRDGQWYRPGESL